MAPGDASQQEHRCEDQTFALPRAVPSPQGDKRCSGLGGMQRWPGELPGTHRGCAGCLAATLGFALPL